MATVLEMAYRTLGRTGLRVSRIGLGAGGPSRLGLSTGADASDVERLVKQAVDLGINLIDTAPAYGTEEVLGQALRSVTEEMHVATKITCYSGSKTGSHTVPITDPQHVYDSVEKSLRALGRDVIDILQLHGVPPQGLDLLMEALVPAMQRLVEQGKVRFLGVTEFPVGDPKQDVAVRVCTSGVFDTFMVHYSILDQEAERRTFPLAREQDIGILCMSAARRAFSTPEELRRTLDRLFPGEEMSLEFLLQGPVRTYSDAAYKFAAAQEAIQTILVGTGNPEHLVQNTAAILGEPLPEEHMRILRQRFGHVEGKVMFPEFA